MDARKYLLQIEKIDRMIKNKIAEAEHWQSIAENTTSFSGGERVQSSGSKQKMADAICEYIDIEREEVSGLFDKKRSIIKTIQQLETDEYEVLNGIYVQYKDFNEVAAKMEKSYSWATSKHGTALTSLQRLLDERKGEKDD